MPACAACFLQPFRNEPCAIKSRCFGNSKITLPQEENLSLGRKQYLTPCSARLLVEKLQGLGANGQPVEMTSLFNFATFDVMAELCFGHPLGLLEKNEFSPWLSSVFASVRMLPIVSMIRYYPLLDTLFTYFEPQSVNEQRRTHCQFSADRVDQRLREGNLGKPDVWRFVEDAEDEKLSLKEMHSNAELFMLAGSETTGTSSCSP